MSGETMRGFVAYGVVTILVITAWTVIVAAFDYWRTGRRIKRWKELTNNAAPRK